MKKLLSLVLICAMGFGMISCVESEESQSVTDLRNAKAEQLRALADYYKAQAEAERITAAAEAAYKQAQAAYQQAQADAKQNEIEQAKAKFAYEIEKIKAEYEAAMLKAMKEAKGYEKELLAMANDKLEQLYTTYSGYVTKLNEANKNLLDTKIELARVEAALVDVTEAANQEIEDNTALIKELEAKLAVLTDNGYSQMDKDSLEAEYHKALAAWNDADYNYQLNEKAAYDKAKEAAEKASQDFDNSITDKNQELKNVSGKDNMVAKTTGNSVWTVDQVHTWNTIWYVWAEKQMVDDDNDPETPDVEQEVILGPYTSRPSGHPDAYKVKTDDGYYVVDRWSSNWDIWTNTEFREIISVDLDEVKLAEFKNNAVENFNCCVKTQEDAELALEEATEDETTLKALETVYKTAEDAREIIYDFEELYNEYFKVEEVTSGNWVYVNTVNAKEAALKQAVADTTGLHTAVKTATADLDVLTNDKNEDYATNALVKALADAQAALKALKSDATADEKAAAEKKVADAQAALTKAIYAAEVALVDAKNTLADAEKEIAEAKAAVETAKENEKAMLTANTAAVAAVAEIQKAYGEGSEFNEYWNGKEYNNEEYEVISYTAGFIADKNQDGTPDLNLDANNGTYVIEYLTVYNFAKNVSRNDNGDVSGWSVPGYEDIIKVAEIATANAKNELTAATNNIAKLTEWVNNWDAKEAELRAWVEAKNAEIDDVVAAYEAYKAADEAKETAKAAVDALEAKADLLSTMMGMNADSELTNLIEDIEDEIEEAQEAIKEAEAVLASLKETTSEYDSWFTDEETIAFREALIEGFKADIAALEAEVEYYTQMVENAKAALDAELSAQNAE